jgi:hypothetical protein
LADWLDSCQVIERSQFAAQRSTLAESVFAVGTRSIDAAIASSTSAVTSGQLPTFSLHLSQFKAAIVFLRHFQAH